MDGGGQKELGLIRLMFGGCLFQDLCRLRKSKGLLDGLIEVGDGIPGVVYNEGS